MPETELEGFVLDAHPLTDHSFTVRVFTRSEGLLSAVYRAPKGRHFSASMLSPLSLVGFGLQGKEQANLKRMVHSELLSSSHDLASRYHHLMWLQHVAWLVLRSQAPLQPDERVFRLLLHLMDKPDLSNRGGPARLLYLEAWLLFFSGMLPRIHSADQVRFDEAGGRVMLHDLVLASGEHVLTGLDRRCWQAIFKLPIEDFARVALEWDGLTGALRGLGYLWEQYLAAASRIRRPLIQYWIEKGIL